MMKNKKTIPLILLVIFTFFLSYTFYESEIKYSGNERDYYFKYFIIFIFLIIFSIISFFLKKEILNNILTIFFSFLFGIYLINIYLIITKEEVINNRMGLFELYKNYKNNDKNISVSMKPQLMIGDDGYPLFSFSDRSNRKTLHCNEGGYFSIFDTDRYGFNNPDEQWGKKIIDFFLVGDSHTHGSCVNEPDTISGNLRKTTNMGVLNLGFSKMGPLQEYAVLREYLPTIKTNRVLWMYSETNDLTDLSDELNNELLKKYLKDETFLQNLHKRQNEIDRKLENVLLSIYEQKKKEFKRRYKTKILSFVRLYELRDFSKKIFNPTLYYKPLEPLKIPDINLKIFSEIIYLSKQLSEKNGAKFYFVFIPDYYRYNNKSFQKAGIKKYENVMKILNELNVPIVNIDIDLLKNHPDPLSLYPNRARNHFNELGYKLISETILKKINEYENKQN